MLIKGGAERVVLAILQAFPGADLYTLAYRPDNTFEEFSAYEVRTSFANVFVRNNFLFRCFYPLNQLAMEWLSLDGYDLVISSSATVAKHVRAPNAVHICYCYFPTRAIWQGDRYFGKSPIGLLKRFLSTALKKRDYAAAQRVDHFITLSTVAREAIAKYYGRQAHIVESPLDSGKFSGGSDSVRDQFYLVVSRLEPWKALDYSISAFSRLGLPLLVVGDGPDRNRLEQLAAPNVRFCGSVSDEELVQYYRWAKAVIFTPELEYGLVPLEANACGTPVIAYGFGGIRETMLEWTSDMGKEAHEATALFFYEQSADAVVEVVRLFETLTFDPNAIQRHADRFSVPEFQRRLKDVITGLIGEE